MKTIPPPILSRLGGALGSLMLLILLNSPWPTALAAPVTSKDAAAAVLGWLSVNPKPLGETLGGSVQSVDTFNDQSGNPAYYIVYLDPSGFVIVSADDLVEPIVGFAPAGQFDPSQNNPLGALVSNDLPARLAYAQLMNATTLDTNAVQAQAKWTQLDAIGNGTVITPKVLTSVSDVRVAPLTQTTWSQQTAADAGQAACYNYYTPPFGAGNTTNYPAGCVATAMAQLMRYWQYPTTGVGTVPCSIKVDGVSTGYTTRGGDGSGGPYVWSNMPLAPAANATLAQCQALGALVADAGGTVSMQYSNTGSSSSVLDAKTALVNTFHFGSAIKGWNNNLNIGANLVAMINPNLDARLPVLLGISGTPGGHAVVADGYGYVSTTLYHHLNLGWSGLDTAWYNLPTIDTSLGTFNVISGCVYNAYTNGSGEIISGRVLDQIGRPVTNATVTATRTGGVTYTATTDTQGIYALAGVPSNSTYSNSVTKTNYISVSTNVTTGTSSDMTATTGNRWVSDLTMNMLTTALDHLAWGGLAATQSLNYPFGVTITARNLTNGLATGFTGPVALSAYASGLGSSTTIIGNLVPTAGISSSADLTRGYAFTPSTNIQVTAVRAYTGDKVSIWTDSGMLVTSQAVAANGSWVEAALATPVILSAGTTYRVAAHYGAGVPAWYTTSWPTTFANGTVGQNLYTANGDAFPLQVDATGEGELVDLRYQVAFSNPITVSPSSSGAFANGVWTGSLTLWPAATNVVLKADDGAGHTALSTPFNLVSSLALLSPRRPTVNQFQCTILGPPGQHVHILTSSNQVTWTTNTTLTNTTGTTLYTDNSASPSKRFYRARQAP